MVRQVIFALLVSLTFCQSSNNENLKFKKCCNTDNYFDMVKKSCRQKEKYSIGNKYGPNLLSNSTPDGSLEVGMISCKDLTLSHLPSPWPTKNPEEKLPGWFAKHKGQEFCIEWGARSGDATVFPIAVTCNKCKRKGHLCIPTCCPKLLLDDSGQCLNNDGNTEDELIDLHSWEPNFSNPNHKVEHTLVNVASKVTCTPNPSYPYEEIFLTYEDSIHRILDDGTLELNEPGSNTTESIPYGHYCLGHLQVSNESEPLETTPLIGLCPQHQMYSEERTVQLIYPSFCTVSNIFLFVTFLIYAMLPDLHGPLFGKVVMVFVLALFAAYLTVSVVFFLKFEFKIYHPYACKVIGYFVQFFFLHAFLWMNVLAFHIMLTFRNSDVSSRDRASGMARTKNRRTLILYTFYTVGMALIITIITAVVDHALDEQNSMRPGIGATRCFFDRFKPLPQFVFYFLPLLLIQVSNMIFFSTTIFKLKQTWRMSRIANLRAHNLPESAGDHFNIIIRLFLIMGINWFFEFLSFIASWAWDDNIARHIFYVNDAVNLLQGVLIFVLLICKKSVFMKLRQKLFGITISISEASNDTFRHVNDNAERKTSISQVSKCSSNSKLGINQLELKIIKDQKVQK